MAIQYFKSSIKNEQKNIYYVLTPMVTEHSRYKDVTADAWSCLNSQGVPSFVWPTEYQR